tara:strand:+ start:1277 stop:1801 length:525 start_codon:yes stop_codon:yes gene_type:complete
MINLNDTVKGVFLLVLAVAGNFIAETLGCKSQKLLSENMYAKHFISIFILYFAIGFVNSEEPEHPMNVMKSALIIYILFILFTKMDITFTLIVFSVLAATYVLSTYIDYYKKVTPEDNELIEKLEYIQKMSYSLMIGLILIGFGLYFKKQYKDYYKTWSTSKFLFGVNKCKSMQ